MNLIYLIIAAFLFSCQINTPCNRKIKQPSDETGYKLYHFDGRGYVVGKYDKTAIPNERGIFDLDNLKYDTIFIRLVFDPRINSYYPFPENQYGGYNTIWEQDSCKAKEHWFKYEKQWKR